MVNPGLVQMNKKIASFVLSGLVALVVESDHPKQISGLPTLDESKPVVRLAMKDSSYPGYYSCEVYSAYETKMGKVTLYDCESEVWYFSFRFRVTGHDGYVDYVAVYPQKENCVGMYYYYTRDDAAKWQPMLEQVKKSRKLEVKTGKFTRAGFC